MTFPTFLFALVIHQGEARLTVGGDVQKPRNYTNAELQKAFAARIKDVDFTLKGEKGHARAVPLVDLIQASLENVDPKRKNALLAYAVVATAEDGYTVVFSAGELAPDVGKRAVWVAVDWNGKPLSAADGPVRLIVPDDEKPSRWVHGTRSLRVVDLGAAPGSGLPSPLRGRGAGGEGRGLTNPNLSDAEKRSWASDQEPFSILLHRGTRSV